MIRSNALVLAAVLVIAGCGSSPQPPGAVTIRHFGQEIVLTLDGPLYEPLGIRLVRIEPDRTTVMHVDATDEVLAARPAEPFLGRRGGHYNVRIFGESGVTLMSADPSSQRCRVGTSLGRLKKEWLAKIMPPERPQWRI